MCNKIRDFIEKNNMMVKIVFFVLFYVILGTSGIWLQLLVNKNIARADVAIGLVTIVASTVGYNATEKVVQLFDDSTNKHKKTNAIINISAMALSLILTMIVCELITNKIALVISILAYLGSCCFWWFHNWNNKNFEDDSPVSALGGMV